MNTLKPFWLVWRDGGYTPSVKHETKASARNEAARLAKMNDGVQFHVLELVSSAHVRTVEWAHREVHGDDCACPSCIPF